MFNLFEQKKPEAFGKEVIPGFVPALCSFSSFLLMFLQFIRRQGCFSSFFVGVSVCVCAFQNVCPAPATGGLRSRGDGRGATAAAAGLL